ncbi:MAG: phosphate regulon sensor histidine kinase PhoR [Burkholderiales bacterium]|nr:phosphate regulon sensor histidine kinase PhoR [Burkholderiales bacterium]
MKVAKNPKRTTRKKDLHVKQLKHQDKKQIDKLQKKTEKAEAKELRFKQTLGALPDGVVLLLKNWEIQWLNPIAQKDLGIDPNSAIGQNITAIEINPELIEFIKAGDFTKTLQITTKTRKILEARIISSGTKYWVLVTRDITEHERADAFRRDFVSNVSHELRTPLTVIKGFLELLQNSPHTEEEKLHYTLMAEQVQRMSTLVDDLLTLGKLEERLTSPNLDEILLLPLLEHAAEEGRMISNGQHTIVVEGDKNLTLLGSNREIMSAVVNLVTNAVRYTPNGGSILISCRKTQEGAFISVKDNGIGIAPADVPRVTERFYRVDKSRSRGTGGTGLGLAIVKHVIFRHQGQLEIHSELGKGSDFRIIFPKSRITHPKP